ncbi:hypothetical protein ASPWEDRAFT_168197 [Aspergillus wentii DTO 134E9]|uniref:Cyanovirin-N domain-containing protein n=1 Tax=Aspergillus wentii DTO 134E9 TaxID=1073089 RepID=A0A1L9RTZ1_ASPWE|nr:uncharacterized protein ASPWEDRAFT_168197 [Aspergillus wentii DTO 134E9]KAI9933923.1 hypothetical protein MW887_004995 [Aspergillus wentii]OJJ38277.1 hypothetical protein ASPWEDRAFT_168197 [Aspergillus wentii DTO 134E9]
MSFHHSAKDIHIEQDGQSTFLLCHVSDNNGNFHGTKIRLDDHIGNSDGWFKWGGVNFTQSARNIALVHTNEGPKLEADLSMINGGSRGRQGMFLSQKITNEGGRLRFIGGE